MFPKNFMFGISMSGFQFEMGSGDGTDLDPNTDWFVWVHDFGNILNGVVSGDLPEHGAGYWHNFAAVHQLLVDFGLDTIRIGTEWSRIFPTPTDDIDIGDPELVRRLDSVANKNAVEHYRKIMEDIKSRGLRLMVNLNHFTLPLWIHDPVAVRRGERTDKLGWVSERTVAEFAKYATYMAWKFGDIVDMWSTQNEPHVVSQLGYFVTSSGFPPSYFDPGWYTTATANLAKAHNLSYGLMKRFIDKPVGVIYSFTWYDTINPADTDIFESAMQISNWNYMDRVREHVDFIGLNYYTRAVIDRLKHPVDLGSMKLEWYVVPGYGYACPEGGTARSGRPASEFGWEMYPEGLYKLIKVLASRYGKPLIVTESGIADATDKYRAVFIVSHLHYIERAVEEGYDVRGYLHWSIIDNFEWAKGYSKRFGLAYTDFRSKTYHPRPSMYVLKEIVEKRTTEHLIGFDPYGLITK